MAAITSVQAIANDQSEVYSVIETLFADNGIESTNIQTLDIATFGANKFIIQVTY